MKARCLELWPAHRQDDLDIAGVANRNNRFSAVCGSVRRPHRRKRLRQFGEPRLDGVIALRRRRAVDAGEVVGEMAMPAYEGLGLKPG